MSYGVIFLFFINLFFSRYVEEDVLGLILSNGFILK